MQKIFIDACLLLLVYASTWFLIALYKKRNDVADIAWGPGYILICIYLFLTQPYSPLSFLMMVLVTIWGIRLSWHIYSRNKNKAEDYRYRAWREEWGNYFYIRSYLQVFILQGFILLLVISPLMLASFQAPPAWDLFTFAGIAIWLTGFIFQAIGDHQLSVFIKERKSSAVIMQTGLWKYSRHPNYFGEILMWWGLFTMVIPLNNSWWVLISPLLISYLLVFVSGIPMLEKKYKGNPAFEDYKRRTSALIPMPSKK